MAQKLTLTNSKVSYFPYNEEYDSFRRKSLYAISFEEFVNGVDDETRKQIDYVRSLYGTDGYKAAKKKMGLYWIGAYANDGICGSDHITRYNNIISIDIDAQDNVDYFKQHTLDEVKAALIDLPGCVVAMNSISNHGLVLYILVERLKDNDKLYAEYYKMLFEKNGIKLDDNAVDFNTRRRFASVDPNMYVNWDVEPFELDEATKSKLQKMIDGQADAFKTDNTNLNPNGTYKIDCFAQPKSKKYIPGPYFTTHKFNDVKIDYLDNTKRFKYVATIKSIFGTDKKYMQLVNQIYDFSFDGGKHSRKDAYHHISSHWSRSSTRGIFDDIAEELVSLGVLEYNKEYNSNDSKGLPVASDNVLNIELVEGEEGNQYLGDHMDELLDFFEPGINMLVSGTGTGKTELFNKIAETYKDEKIAIIEPFNAIVDNKYDVEKTHIAAGSGNFIDLNYHYNATNYNKFTMMVEEEMNKEPKDRTKLNQLRWACLDESHLSAQQNFRSETLNDFFCAMNWLVANCPNIKVVLMTATPGGEEKFFDIKKVVNVEKKLSKFIQVRMTNNLVVKGDECVPNRLMAIVKKTIGYVNEGRKVLTYWSSGSVRNMKRVKKVLAKYGINAAIVHNRNKGNQDMPNIMTDKMLGDKYDVVIASCCFGAGCDLNDESNVAVIVVGNNPYQEDIQAIGRWRNSKNIVCDIMMDKAVTQTKADYDRLLDGKKIEIERDLAMHKNNKWTVLKGYDHGNVDYLAEIAISALRYSDIKTKCEYLKADKGIMFLNDVITTRDDRGRTIYEVVEQGSDCMNYEIIDADDNDWNIFDSVTKSERQTVDQLKETYYGLLLDGKVSHFKEWMRQYQDVPTLVDWFKALNELKYAGKLNEFIRLDKEVVLKASYKNMSDLLRVERTRGSIAGDKVEIEILDRLYYAKEHDENMEQIMALCYAKWVLESKAKKESDYDLNLRAGNYDYSIYEKFRMQYFKMLNTDSDIAAFIRSDNSMSKTDNDMSAAEEFFGHEVMLEWTEPEEQEKTRKKNKAVSMGMLAKFFSYVKVKYINKDKDKMKEIGGSKGGKAKKKGTNAGKANKTNSNKGNSGIKMKQYKVINNTYYESRDRKTLIGFEVGDIITTVDLPDSISRMMKTKWIKKQLGLKNIELVE